MDVTELIQTGVTKEVVLSSPTKKGVILSGGVMKTFPDGKQKLSLLVEMDGKQLNYTPNKTTMKKLADRYGKESIAWVGKLVEFEVGMVRDKEAILIK